MNKKDILDLLTQNKSKLKNSYGLKSIALFGSFAREEATNKSDIDILVDITPSFQNLYNLKLELEKLLKNKVDLVTQNSLRSYIKEKIKKDLVYV